MNNLIFSVLETSITMSVIALILIALSSIIFKKYAAKTRYYAWLIVIIGLICPFRFTVPTAIIQIEAPISIGAIPIATTGTYGGLTSTHSIAGGTVSISISLFTILGIIWLIGVLCFIIYHINRHRKFLKIVKRFGQDVIDKNIIDLLANVCKELGIRKEVKLKTCFGIGSPMMIGFFKPTILLGTENISKTELAFIFKHELIHWSRRDLWYKALVLIAVAIHWFNPIIHIIAKEISVQCEISCDAEVTKNADSSKRFEYVESIIGVIRQEKRATSILTTSFYSGKKGMKKRVFSIMDSKCKKLGIFIPMIILMFTLATGSVFALNITQPITTPTAPKPVVTLPPKVEPVVQNINTDAEGSVSVHSIEKNIVYIYGDEKEALKLEKGEKLLAVIELDKATPTGVLSFGYMLDGKKVTIYSDKVENGIEIRFTAPQAGDYKFFIESSDDKTLNLGISFFDASMLIENKGFKRISF